MAVADQHYIEGVASSSPSVNPITGTIGKAFDTFLDALAVQGANKLVGSVYPTGGEDPAAVAARNAAAASAAPATDYKPILIWVGIGLAALAGVVVIVKVASK